MIIVLDASYSWIVPMLMKVLQLMNQAKLDVLCILIDEQFKLSIISLPFEFSSQIDCDDFSKNKGITPSR